jgi:hypothetical protein
MSDDHRRPAEHVASQEAVQNDAALAPLLFAERP